MVKITATVSKTHNSQWAGRGDVVSIDLASGTVILKMTTGKFKDSLGGFDIARIRFHSKVVA